MPNYQNSKIYTLRSYQTEKIYIGSTCDELRKRLYRHKAAYKSFLKNNDNLYCSSYEIIKYNDCFIELYIKYPCNDRYELRKKEGEIIRKLECVNKFIAGRSYNEYRNEHKEYYKKIQQNYYKKNKEQICKKQKEYYQNNKDKKREYEKKNKDKRNKRAKENIYLCSCGSKIRKDTKSKHLKTKKHLNFIKLV